MKRATSRATLSRASIARHTVRRTRGGSTSRASPHTRPAAGARVRLPFFSGDLLEDVQLEIPVREDLLQAAVFLLQLAQPLDVGRLERAEVFAPAVNRLGAHAMLVGHLRDRLLIGLPQ